MDPNQDTGDTPDPVKPGEQPENNANEPSPKPDGQGNEGKTAEELQKELDKAQMELNMHRNKANQSDENNQATQDYVANLAKKESIDEFLQENKSDFPDVSRDDLMIVDDPEQLKDYAGIVQRRIDEATQRRLKEIQKAGAPNQTPDERDAKLAKAKKDGNFAAMVEARTTPTNE